MLSFVVCNATIAVMSACVRGSANFLPAALQAVFAADHEIVDPVVWAKYLAVIGAAVVGVAVVGEGAVGVFVDAL